MRLRLIQYGETLAQVDRTGALLMRPLILRASSKVRCLSVDRTALTMIHTQRNVDVHPKRIFKLRRVFRLEDLFNALRASKIVGMYTTTGSFEDFSERGFANTRWQFQELDQFEAKSAEP